MLNIELGSSTQMLRVSLVGTLSRIRQHIVDASLLESFLFSGQQSRSQSRLPETHCQTVLVLLE